MSAKRSFDVIIIGPTGKAPAPQLSDSGHSVATIERRPASYPFPRAVGCDHEIRPAFRPLGLGIEIETISPPTNHWCIADWSVLINLDETRDGSLVERACTEGRARPGCRADRRLWFRDVNGRMSNAFFENRIAEESVNGRAA